MRGFVCFLLSKILTESNAEARISVPAMQFICYCEQNRSTAFVPFHIT